MSILADRYAQALFDAATEAGEQEAVAKDLAAFAELLADRTVKDLLLLPSVPLERKLAAVDKAFGTEGDRRPLVTRALRLILEHRRAEILPDLAAAFRKRLLASQGTIEGRLETARPLSDDEVERLAQAVGKQLGKKVQLAVTVDPELIGGVRITVGHRMYDNTVTALLADMKQRLLATHIA